MRMAFKWLGLGKPFPSYPFSWVPSLNKRRGEIWDRKFCTPVCTRTHSQRPLFFLTPDVTESLHGSAVLRREHPEPVGYHVPRLDQLIRRTKGRGGKEKLQNESGSRNGVHSTWSHKFRNSRLGCVCYGRPSTRAKGKIRIQDYSPHRESSWSHLPRIPIKSHKLQTH